MPENGRQTAGAGPRCLSRQVPDYTPCSLSGNHTLLRPPNFRISMDRYPRCPWPTAEYARLAATVRHCIGPLLGQPLFSRWDTLWASNSLHIQDTCRKGYSDDSGQTHRHPLIRIRPAAIVQKLCAKLLSRRPTAEFCLGPEALDDRGLAQGQPRIGDAIGNFLRAVWRQKPAGPKSLAILRYSPLRISIHAPLSFFYGSPRFARPGLCRRLRH